MCADASKCRRATCGTDGRRTQAWCKKHARGKEHARPLRAWASAYVAASPASSRASTEPFIVAADAARLAIPCRPASRRLGCSQHSSAAASSARDRSVYRGVSGNCDLLGSSVVAAVYSFVGRPVLFGRAGRGSLAWHACSCAVLKATGRSRAFAGPLPSFTLMPSSPGAGVLKLR
jgi:hypothetical protein